MKKKSVNRERVIKVLVAEDHSVVRQGLVALINRRHGLRVVAEANNGREAVAAYLRHRPDVCLLDLRMPEMDGVQAIEAIRARDPDANIIVLTTYDDDEDIYRALQSGAKTYLLKDITRDDLIDNILATHEGKSFIPPHIALKLAARVSSSALTARELEVLHHLAAGYSNKQIAADLGVSEGTIKLHVNHIFRKLHARGRTHAISIAAKRGLIHVE